MFFWGQVTGIKIINKIGNKCGLTLACHNLRLVPVDCDKLLG